MDSSGSSLSSLTTTEASQLLKDILNVGKARVGPAGDSSVNGIKHSSNGAQSSPYSQAMELASAESGSSVDVPVEKHGAQNSIAELLKTMNHQSLPKQQIWLQGDDNANSFAVYGREVDVIASSRGTSSQGNFTGVRSPAPSSNKIKVNPVVKYEWENKHYAGNLVAVHRNGVYIAYVIKGRSNDGIVRIINRKTAERELVKGFKGSVTDIAFAHLTPIILGAVDEIGNMFVYEILETDRGLEVSSMLQIQRPESTEPSENHRLIWCPYIPEEEDSSTATHDTTNSSVADDVGRLLVLTHDSIAEMWNIDTVTKEYGNGVMTPDEVETGFLTITNHTKPIVDAAFSPDGTALATASLDGEVKFFQVYLQDRAPPRCLHQWQPHEGRPVSSLFFLDDHKHPNPETQFWKFAVTGADQNREIKIWSCESWSCLQTIKFMQAVSPDLPTNFQDISSRPCIKASMDLSSSYLVLSDIRRKVLYVLHLHQESDANTAHVSSISEFMLAHPCLSFSVLDAARRRFKKVPGHDDLGDVTTGEIVVEDDEEVPKKDEGPDVGVIVKMYSVHTKALQELHIAFKPETSAPFLPTPSVSSVSQDGLKDTLSDLSMDTMASDVGSVSQSDISHQSLTYSEQSHHRSEVSQNSNASNTSHVSYHNSQSRQSEGSLKVETRETEEQPLLLAPDAFTSPRKTEVITSTVPDSLRSSNSSSLTQVTAMDEGALRTPHSSVITSQQSHISPGSSVTLTPASTKETSATAEQITPSSIPLPPLTPGEEAALRSPTDSQPPLFPQMPNLSSSSPGTKQAAETISPISSVKTSSDVGGEERGDDNYDVASTRRTTLQSTGSSSSTSLEVSEILEGVRPTNQPGTEEVEEEEFEDAKGDIEDDDEEEGHVELHQRGDTPKEAEDSQELDEVGSLENQPYNKKIWPPPPDVGEVNLEAQRLAADAIQRAAYHVHAIDGEEELGPQQEEGDVEIEEEKEEEVGDDNSVPDDIPPPKATSSEIEETLSSIDSPARKSRTSPGFRANLGGRRSHAAKVVDAATVSQLQASVQQMLSMLQYQQREIESIRSELQDKQETGQVMSNLQTQMDNLEGALASRVAASLSEHTQSEAERLHGLLSEKEALERQKQERLLNTVSQTLDRTISSRLDKTVREEMRQRVIPSLGRSLDPLKEQLHAEMAQRLTATDAVMKENLSKLVRSRQTVDAIGQAAGNAIQGPVHAAIRDLIVPGFERASQAIFHQMNEVFQRGMHEYIRHLEHHMEVVRKKHEETRDPIVGQLRSMVDAFKRREDAYEPLYRQMNTIIPTVQTSVAQIQTSQQELEQHIKQSLLGMEQKMRQEMKEVVKEELAEALKDQQHTISDNVIQCLRSGAVTPAPLSATPDPAAQQARIMTLLQQGQLNEAFQVALSASDLNLVMFVCEKVNPAQVFDQVPCPLQQPVLLSLIQQLSANLINHTEIKHKYLEEAVMNLDASNPVTREHMTTVLGALGQKLMAFIQNHPQEKMTRNIKMLLMASQSLLK